jgi:osmotically-inducible protein OsmY
MYSKPRQLLLVSSIALAIAGGGTALADETDGSKAAATVAQQVTDARQETQIWTTYALSPYLRANDLKVSVHDGNATLTGTVEDGVNRDLAKQIAMGVDGVKAVDNKIVVQADYTPPAKSSERSYGERIDDATITAKVKSKLLWSTYTDGMSTDVDTKLGKVTLTGSADTAAAKELAGSLAKNTTGVVSVDNQLIIKSPTTAVASAREPAHDGNIVTDTWISAKIKSTYMYSRNVDSSDIEVNTSDGVVTLSGKVDSGAERALAVELAKNIRGVNSVESKDLII